jgi:transposase
VEDPIIMRALEPEVVDVIWQTVEPRLPVPVETHPLGCHRPRVPDRLCFRGILIRLVTGASWVDIEAILDHQVSDTTRRARRDEWIDAGVFESHQTGALAAFDRIVGLDLDDVALDGSLHKAPYGGEGTGPNPTDRSKLGWKWSVASERHGIPIGWAIDGANRHDVRMLEPTLDAIHDAGLLAEIAPCTSIVPTTPAPSATGSGPPVSRSSRSNDVGPRCSASRDSRCGSGCDGSSNRPTPGGRTTANSAATPTAEPDTATQHSASPPPSSSSEDSSTGEIAGAPRDTYPLRS